MEESQWKGSKFFSMLNLESRYYRSILLGERMNECMYALFSKTCNAIAALVYSMLIAIVTLCVSIKLY